MAGLSGGRCRRLPFRLGQCLRERTVQGSILQTRTTFLLQELRLAGEPGDFDSDDDIDLRDCGAVLTCYTADAPAECATQPCRDTFDFDDYDVDLHDFKTFANLLRGP